MYYSYEQYREAQDDMFSDYCGGNEFQNAYELSRIEESMNIDDKHLIQKSLAEGKFVVTYQMEVYCRFTDASIGFRDHLISVHDTLAEAEAVLAERPEDDLNIEKPYSSWKPPVRSVDNSDMPF